MLEVREDAKPNRPAPRRLPTKRTAEMNDWFKSLPLEVVVHVMTPDMMGPESMQARYLAEHPPPGYDSEDWRERLRLKGFYVGP
jgi:hypothetical protein